jgi:hypothetical protein
VEQDSDSDWDNPWDELQKGVLESSKVHTYNYDYNYKQESQVRVKTKPSTCLSSSISHKEKPTRGNTNQSVGFYLCEREIKNTDAIEFPKRKRLFNSVPKMSYKKSRITTCKTHNSRSQQERVPPVAEDDEENRALAGALRNGSLSSLASPQAELERKEETDFLGLVPRDGWKAKDGDGAEAELAADPSIILKRRGNDETVQKVKKKPLQMYGPSHTVEHPSSPFTLYMSNNNKKLLRKMENKLTKCILKDRKKATYISQKPQLNVSRKASYKSKKITLLRNLINNECENQLRKLTHEIQMMKPRAMPLAPPSVLPLEQPPVAEPLGWRINALPFFSQRSQIALGMPNPSSLTDPTINLHTPPPFQPRPTLRSVVTENVQNKPKLTLSETPTCAPSKEKKVNAAFTSASTYRYTSTDQQNEAGNRDDIPFPRDQLKEAHRAQKPKGKTY